MCENEIFVLVRYKVDHTTAVVSSTKIRNFCPITIEDFNPDVLYEVFWSGDQNTRGGYYEAQIIDMAERKDDLQVSRRRRRRIKPLPTAAATEFTCPANKKKEKLLKKASKRQRDVELLNKIDHEHSVPLEQHTAVLRKLKEKTKALERCQKLNVELQEALCIKITKAECHQCQKAAAGDSQPVYYLDCNESYVDDMELHPGWSSLEEM
ncbi:uncharacterized protein LOC115317554, partial [Ixodes scapularis]|uniref:uncharacterized protein LOC115317554 n=1 Tax=Ixodes scapularis TaxID=6945 RepID=UPI001C37F48E